MTSAATIAPTPFNDPGQRLREVMSEVCTPVSVVTAMASGRAHGSTVSAFTSLSLDPPMILVALNRESDTLAAIRSCRSFGLNLLRAGQTEVALQFATKEADKFRNIAWSLDAGVPRIDGSSGWVRCRVSSLTDGGDHVIVNGLVEDASVVTAYPPLTYHRRGFGTHAPQSA